MDSLTLVEGVRKFNSAGLINILLVLSTASPRDNKGARDRLDRCDVCPQSGFNDAGRRGTASVFLRIHNDKVIFLSLMRAHSKQMRARSHSTIKFSIIYFGRSSAGSRFGRPMKS
jgi:hypothetical protein